jgi:hypothetical protein
MGTRTVRRGVSPGIGLAVAAVVAVALLALVPTSAPPVAAGEDGVETVWRSPASARPLGASVRAGLDWLVEHQRADGSWGAGEQIPIYTNGKGRRIRTATGTSSPEEPASLGDTCVAALALIRAGSTASDGPYADAILRAVQYVCTTVENARGDGLTIARPGSRIQAKLGRHVDTHLTTLLLSEAKGKMPSRAGEVLVDLTMARLLKRLERNQAHDGTFGDQGWAKALALALASKGLNRYAQAGGTVCEDVRAKLERAARDRYDERYGTFSKDGSAGIPLYAAAANLSMLQDSVNTNTVREKDVLGRLRAAKTATERREAQRTLDRFRQTEEELRAARRTVLRMLRDKSFVRGFGSNGGEEFLSYLCISESLVAAGGASWTTWDARVAMTLAKARNRDGSWSGHHCITGRTFCTATALLSLMADRTPIPVNVAVTESLK